MNTDRYIDYLVTRIQALRISVVRHMSIINSTVERFYRQFSRIGNYEKRNTNAWVS